ncbi:MAG TPA: metal ABC transporter substrate-binding protein [Beijerinckiaceae bacterium]|nr:metal ABC transporter substrate-binding protein [Beijerinckiaceae bacterium]
MRSICNVIALLGTLLAGAVPAAAQDKVPVVASFSILADLVRQVGGERVTVTTLVGPDADAHVYQPTPGDSRRIAEARLVVMNGLAFEGWMTRLVRSSGTKAPVVEAAKGVRAIEAKGHGHGHGHSHDVDPHAWHDVANVKIYVRNIRDALASADPAGKEEYAQNAQTYLARLDALDGEIRATVERIPASRRRVITSHDSFAYFARAYGLRFVAPRGVSTDAEASAQDVARIIRQIRQEKIEAVFLENVADPRLMERIAKESGARIGGRLYSDALSGPDGPAPTYIDLMRHNIRAFGEALSS